MPIQHDLGLGLVVSTICSSLFLARILILCGALRRATKAEILYLIVETIYTRYCSLRLCEGALPVLFWEGLSSHQFDRGGAVI